MSRLPRQLARLIERSWPLLLLGGLLLGAVSIPRMVSLFKHISSDPVDLLRADQPNVQTLLEVRNKLQKGTTLSIVVESDDPEVARRYVDHISEVIAAHPLVGEVLSRKVGYEFFNRHKLLFLDLEDLETIRDRIDRRIQKEKLGKLYIDLEEDFQFGDIEEKYRTRYTEGARNEYYVSDDGRIYNIYVRSADPRSGLAAASQFQDAIATLVRQLEPEKFHPTLKLYLAGSGKVLEYRALVRDLKKAGIVSGICIFLPLLFRFRNPIFVGLIFAPLLLGIPVSLAFSSLFIPKLNVTTSFLFAILGGLGIENGIHIFSRYYEMRSSGRKLGPVLEDLFAHTGRAIVTSVASVAVTFLLLVVSDFRGFSEFGLISGVGLWIIFGTYFTFFPALLVFAEKIRLLRFRHRAETELAYRFVISPKLAGAVLTGFAIFSLFSFGAPAFTQFEYRSDAIRADLPDDALARAKKDQTRSRVNKPAVIVIHSEEEARALKKAIRFAKERGGASSSIDMARSYYDLVPYDQSQKLEVIAEMRRLLADPALKLVKGEHKEDLDRFKQELRKTTPIRADEVPEAVKEVFIGREEVPGSILFINAQPDLELSDGRNAMQFVSEAGRLETPLGTYHPSSDAIIYGLVLKTLFRDVKWVLLVSLISIAFFIWLDFRNVRKSAIVLVSIVMGVFWLLGVMLLAGIKFNFYNIIIIPAVMGMSIDNSIHVFHRYEELGRGSLTKVLSTTGVAAALSSLTNAGGFVGLLTSIHLGLYSIGLLAVLGVGTCLVSTLVFLPLLLNFLEQRRRTAD